MLQFLAMFLLFPYQVMEYIQDGAGGRRICGVWQGPVQKEEFEEFCELVRSCSFVEEGAGFWS